MERDANDEMSMAFNRLEKCRQESKDFFGPDFDWEKEVQEALDEKYGLGQNDVDERLEMAHSLHGIIPDDITLEEAREERLSKIAGARGSLAEYAKSGAMEQEEGAWERAVVERMKD